MTDLIKGVLGGGWSLLLGWLFPSGLSVGLFLFLVAPSINDAKPLKGLENTSTTTQALLVIGAAATLGVLLNAMQTPLYRVLEGYLLWPAWLAKRRQRRHIERRRALEVAVNGAEGYRAGLAAGRLQRYPDDEKRIVPTTLGNAIRRFEVYGWSRYRLNTQTLWYRIVAVVPEVTLKAVDTARANVDFFICLLYGQLLVASAAAVALLAREDGASRLIVALGLSLIITVMSYRMAIVATDEWNAAVKALADLGRVPLATALGLVLPQTLAEEREMWRAVYLLDRDGYSEDAQQDLDAYRRTDRVGEN